MAKDLTSALGLGPREHVALVGGGGKTSLMQALAKELKRGGARVVTTTTTKLSQKEAQRFPCVILCSSDSSWHQRLREGLESYGSLFVAQRLLDSGKVEGVSPQLADSLFKDPLVDHLILEADGSAGRPLKAPAAHEPVIPSSVSLVVAMMGLEAIGKQLGPQVVFRPGLYEKVTGLKQGLMLTPNAIAKVFRSTEGLFKNTPGSARRVAFLNKLDLLRDHQKARELTDLLLRGPHPAVDTVVVGSVVEKNYTAVKRQ